MRMTFEELTTAVETATAEDAVHLLYDYFKTWNPDLLPKEGEED